MKKTKKKNAAWVGVLVYTLIGAACGFLLIRFEEQPGSPSTPLIWGVFILSVYAAMMFQIVIHEAGHLVFGLATGYRFQSFRIFSLMWIKNGDRLCFKRMSLAGTGGQCLMSPPDLQDGKMPFLLYNFGGVIMNLISGAFFFLLSLLVPPASLWTVFFQVMALIGVAYAIINGVPLHLGPVDNDGCNAFSMMRSEKAVRAFWGQMKVNEMISRGTRLKDMPQEWFIMPEDADMDNSIIATQGVFSCNRLMDGHRLEEADKQMAHMLSVQGRIPGLYLSFMTVDRIFIELIGPNRKEVLDAMMTKELQKIMKAMKNYPSILRTQYAWALMADRDSAKARDILAQFERTAATYPYPSEIAGERELIQMVPQSPDDKP